MKKLAAVVGLAGLVMLAGAFFWRTVKVQAMAVPINVKDLPEYGVRIIAAPDRTFARRAESFFKGQPQTIADRIKPLSVLLENAGSLAIVGTTVKWEIEKRDGTKFSQPVSSVNTRALMDGEPRLIQTTTGAAIPPHSTRFVSVLGSAQEGQQVDLSRSWIAFRGSPSEGEAFRRALAESNMQEAFNRSIIGTDAQYDLYMEVTVAQYQGKTLEEIFNRVAEFATNLRTRESGSRLEKNSNKQGAQPSIESANRRYSDEYLRSKALYAQELLGMRGVVGAKEAIAQKLQLLDKPRKLLRRR